MIWWLAGFLPGCLSVSNTGQAGGKDYVDEPDWSQSNGDDDSQSDDDFGDDDLLSDDDVGSDDDADGVGGPTSELQLPFLEGEAWQLTRSYNEGSHMDYGYDWVDDRYALDFALAGCDPWRKPIYPVREGTVEVVGYDDDGYGNYVLIDHGQGYKSRYAHFDEAQVYAGQEVTQNDVIGLCGNSGYVLGSACPEHPGTHLHFAFYKDGDGAVPEPMSGHVDFQTGCWYGHHGYIDCDGDGSPDEPLGDDDDVDPGDDDSDSDDDTWGDDDLADDDSDPQSDDDTTPDCLDNDGDGYGVGADCLGEDCNDSHSQIYPGAPEQEDAWDNDCDSLIDEGTDSYDDDGDGYTEHGGDCNDSDATISPSATEIECDGVDQDCSSSDFCPDPNDCDYTVPLEISTIQEAIDLAVTSEIVCVEAGNYYEDLVFVGEDITVRSLDGWEATHLYGVGTDMYDQTVLAENNETSATVLEGFTVHGVGGRVIVMTGAALTLRQLYLPVTVSYTGIIIENSPGAVVHNVRIEGADSYGIMMGGATTQAELSNLVVLDADHSGLNVSNDAEFTLYNSVFYSEGYGGVWITSGYGHVENSIFMGHSYYGLHLDDPAYTLTSDYNTNYDNDHGDWSVYVTPGTGNTTEDPLFTDPTNHDFTLQPGSPCLNAGNSSSSYNNSDGTRNHKGAYGGPYGESW